MNSVLWGVLVGATAVAISWIGSAIADRIRGGRRGELLTRKESVRYVAALDDLWGCVGVATIDQLQPETVALARANHAKLWHAR